jgi:hypothetical protein
LGDLSFSKNGLPSELNVLGVTCLSKNDFASSPVYTLLCAFKNTHGTLKRMKLYVAGKSQDVRNMAAYYKNRLTLPKPLRRRFGVDLSGESIVLMEPGRKPMPQNDVHIIAHASLRRATSNPGLQ